ncbi:hypothetical protein ACIRO1_34390 [Streptomyces sp. NPDC102381]|uniref:hypothetical protein n=1 Tax=Streptomyces sp. NPDC102381 TaxID=3366164 RepID=UPI0037FDCE65
MSARHHALEIALTRPLTHAELARAARLGPLAADAARHRLMAVQRADGPAQAARRLRRRLDAHLPIDVITTHYPNAHGQVLLNVTLPPAAHTALHRNARSHGRTPGHHLELALQQNLADHAGREDHRVQTAVRHLLDGTTPARLLTAVAHALTSPTPQGPTE